MIDAAPVNVYQTFAVGSDPQTAASVGYDGPRQKPRAELDGRIVAKGPVGEPLQATCVVCQDYPGIGSLGNANNGPHGSIRSQLLKCSSIPAIESIHGSDPEAAVMVLCQAVNPTSAISVSATIEPHPIPFQMPHSAYPES